MRRAIITDTSVITCHKIISVVDIVSAKMTSTIGTKVTRTSHSKNVRYKIECNILLTILLVIILLLIIAVICYHCAKHRSKQEDIAELTIQKWRTMKFNKFVLKIVHVVISMI